MSCGTESKLSLKCFSMLYVFNKTRRIISINTFISAIYQGLYSMQHAIAFIWKIFEIHIPSFAIKYCREYWNIQKCRCLLVKYVCLFVFIRLEVMLSWNCTAIQLAGLTGILSWVSTNIQVHYISPWLPFYLVVEMSAVSQ